MKKNIKFLFIIVTLLTIQSCNRYNVTTFQPETNNGAACTNPTYIATCSKTATGATQFSLTLEQLLQDAKASYGQDVTIQNVRWDVEGAKLFSRNKKVSAIYDVIKCPKQNPNEFANNQNTDKFKNNQNTDSLPAITQEEVLIKKVLIEKKYIESDYLNYEEVKIGDIVKYTTEYGDTIYGMINYKKRNNIIIVRSFPSTGQTILSEVNFKSVKHIKF